MTVIGALHNLGAGAACEPPVVTKLLPQRGNGAAVTLQWPATSGAHQYRVWAQWRVPEGEVVHTHETTVATPEARLPPSPTRWRPLKLSLELQAVCAGDTLSPMVSASQWQFDADAEAACQPVDGVQFDQQAGRLTWRGAPQDRFVLTIYPAGPGQAPWVQEVIGPVLAWPIQAARPAVILVVRACGEVQRSRVSFLRVP